MLPIYNLKIIQLFHFEFRDIIYDGITRPATSPETFGLNMKVEWQDGYEWAKVYQQKSSDKLVIRYRPQSDHESYHVRMFDPLLNNTNISITINEPVNNSIYLTSIRLNATANDTVDLCHYAVDDGTNVTFYNRTCTQFIANESNGCGAVGGAFSTNISKWRTGGSSNPANLFDGNGSTCAYALYPNITGILYINMTKPEGVTINSTFMAYLNFTAFNPPNVEQSRKNFTFGDCWNGYNNIVAFRVINNQSVAAEFMSVACWNGTDWFIKWNQTGAELIPYYCDLLVLWDLPITNTSFSTTVGDHNVTVYCQDTNDDCVQSPYTYFTVNNTPIVKVNPNLNESPAQNYAINWILATSDLNFSDQSVIAGNFTYNISQENISIFPFNTSWLFNITNNFAVNITVSLEQNQTSNFYHWWCLNGSIKQWNITDTSLTLFDISPGESYYLNCTLDVFNISQSCTEWNCTQSGTWDFDYNITAR